MLAMLYGAAMHLRNRAFDRGILRAHGCAVPVLSVGNVTAGGAGKTPLVARFAEHFLDQGLRTAVVTRGYGRRTRGSIVVSDGAGAVASWEDGGDEPVMLARALPALAVVADEKRARGCALAVARFAVQRIVLDDAFQHRACARDADIVAVDAGRDLRGDALLPFGRLREPLSALRRASAVILTRCEDGPRTDAAERALHEETDAPVFRSAYGPVVLRRFGSETRLGTDALHGREMLTFCGIAVPASFLRTAEQLGVRSARHMDFNDHHPYTARDIERLRAVAGRRPMLTTEKDAVRLAAHAEMLSDMELFYPVMRATFPDEAGLFALIERLLSRPSEAA
ncbi:MAG: tetraacyldisaccharide 4'-kinase [Ignavibacteria bacterium]|nr:tetraacyldisaccharide 4'-kinase [Ignavibacteria bacterium]